MKLKMLAVTLALTASACGGYSVPDGKTAPAAPTWNNSVKLIMDNHCVRCHGAKPDRGAPGGFRLDVYGTTDNGNIGGAQGMAPQIVESIHDEMPPEGALGPNDTKALERWLANGAPEQ
jgi:hypothetical protein